MPSSGYSFFDDVVRMGRLMKCWDSFIVGMFVGGLVLCLAMLNWPEPKRCGVVISYGNGKVSHVQYGVIVANE